MNRFIRKIQVAVGDGDGDFIFVEDLFIKFSIHIEATSTPPKGNIEVYNLSPESETQVRERGERIRLWAGYDGQEELHLYFDGSLRRVEQEKRGQDRVTNIHIGGKDQSKARNRAISISIFKAPLRSVVTQALSQGAPELGVGPLEPIPDIVLERASFSGPWDVFLDGILKPHKVHWYEDNGVIKFSLLHTLAADLGKGAILISEQTGMVGTPAVTESGGLKVRTLLDYRIELGGSVEVKSEVLIREKLETPYKVTVLEHHGDNRDGGFFTDMELVSITQNKTQS